MSEARRVYLHAVTYLARQTNAYEFRALDGAPLTPFKAGAHVDLILPNGIRRSYSLCNPEGETHRYVVGVKRAELSRGASSYLHDNLRVGDELEIAPPRNHFALHEDARHSVLIAGGIGVTPIVAMARRLASLGAPFDLHYACRTRHDAAFREELQTLAGDRLRMTFDGEPGGLMLDLKAIVAEAPEGSHVYGCGPAPMLDAFEAATAALPAGFAHLERFAGTAEPARAQGAGFDIVLARSKQTFHVPAGKAILDVLLDEGVDIPFSCMDGVCGSCRVAVLAGRPDHRDSVLDAEERAANSAMMVCCSGALSESLTLDL